MVFCHTSTKISHKYTHVPSLPSPSPPHPSACHRAPVWVPWVIEKIPIGYLFYTWYCKFLCYSLHTSPLLPLLWPCPEVCSVCLFLHCCPENEFISAISQFPYIHVSIWCLYFSFWLTSLCIMGSSFVHLIRTDSMCFFLWLGSIPLYMYIPQLLYPFICWWTSRLLPCFSYCK